MFPGVVLKRMSPEKSTLDQLRIDRNAPAKTKSFPWIFVIIGVLLVVGVPLGWWMTRPRAAEVKTWTASESSIGGSKTVLNASGYVVARREATVSSKVTGKVIEVFIEEGLKVKEGQILARLDPSNTKVNLDLAEAQLNAARSGLNETKVRLDEAGKELSRVIGLANLKVASAADLDHAQAEASSLKARLDRQEVEVTVAEVQVKLWQQQMDDTVIRAPFAGVITSKNAQPGEMISPMSAGGGFTRTGICTIVDMESLEVEIDVNESYINRVTPGQPVTATLDAYADWQIPAKVIAIIPTADRQKATVKVRVGFDKLDPRILPQMGVKVAFQGGEQTAAVSRGITIPKGSVRKKNGRDFVWIIQKGRAEERAVTVGNPRGDEITVQSGLAAGEKVVVEGAEKLTEGDAVQEAKR
jgi:HlyD family secretion protein